MSAALVIVVAWFLSAIETSIFLFLPEAIPMPDVALAAAAYLSLRWGGLRAGLAAFLLGCISDSLGGFGSGVFQLCYLSVFIVLGALRGKLLIESAMSEVFIVFAAALVGGLSLRFFGHNFLGLVSPVSVSLLKILSVAFMSAIIAPPLFALFRLAERLTGAGREREIAI